MAQQRIWSRLVGRLTMRRRSLRGALAIAVVVPMAVLTTAGTAHAITPPDGGSSIMTAANDLYHGHAEPYWGGGPIPYVYGGGHLSTHPGPSRPSGASKTGLDCSGFSRYVYYLAWGHEVLGAGSAASQWSSAKGTATSSPVAGNLVFFKNSAGAITHVGVYAGLVSGVRYMYNERHTGDTNIRYEQVAKAGLAVAGYRYYSG